MSEKISLEEYRGSLRKGNRGRHSGGAKTKNKFNAQKTDVGGIVFASRKEARRYSELLQLQKAGAIRNLELQPVIKFSVDGRPVLSRSKRYPNGRQLFYRGDFRYIDAAGECVVIEDAKGFRTKEFIIKKAFVEAMFPGLKVREI